MKNLFIAIGFLFATYAPEIPLLTAFIQKEAPAYAKWSRLALVETKNAYPNAQIVDYLYKGTTATDDLSIATFQLWLKEGDTEFGVIVTVTYTTATEEFKKVEFEEFARPVWKDMQKTPNRS
ncbi:DUF3889 domain-containing protein [Sporosarcina saromensis]|uniref:DUF3889 domain-containing protein n=1 Tax=Sporosarcina saromensis TaxID=359365 RepID=A0ABU4GDB9_9BACL|nr:DUF3889 domain-containing protein [Sporosarcina saromensis]MDW0114295.1 DUF3889 domain-containing protein [Sporosarcina saromensis]